jgi:hypothetical protein
MSEDRQARILGASVSDGKIFTTHSRRVDSRGRFSVTGKEGEVVKPSANLGTEWQQSNAKEAMESGRPRLIAIWWFHIPWRTNSIPSYHQR